MSIYFAKTRAHRGKRNNMNTIMSNPGVQEHMNGVQIFMPMACYNKNGAVKPRIEAKLENLTLGNAVELYQRHGITCELINRAEAEIAQEEIS